MDLERDMPPPLLLLVLLRAGSSVGIWTLRREEELGELSESEGGEVRWMLFLRRAAAMLPIWRTRLPSLVDVMRRARGVIWSSPSSKELRDIFVLCVCSMIRTCNRRSFNFLVILVKKMESVEMCVLIRNPELFRISGSNDGDYFC
jgi:hypothetical protein